MNCKKLLIRMLVALLCVSMLASVFSVTASANTPDVTLVVNDTQTYSSALSGGYYTVKVPISVTQNSGFMSLLFDVVIPDGTYLTAIDDGTVWTSAVEHEELPATGATGSRSFLYYDGLATENNTNTGVLVTLTFKIPEAMLANDGSVEIGVTVTEALKQESAGSSVNPGTTLVPLPTEAVVSATAGEVTLGTVQPGDINLDGVKNYNDAVALCRWVMNIYSSAYAGSRDFNGDGVVNYTDAVHLCRNIMGLVELAPNS